MSIHLTVSYTVLEANNQEMKISHKMKVLLSILLYFFISEVEAQMVYSDQLKTPGVIQNNIERKESRSSMVRMRIHIGL